MLEQLMEWLGFGLCHQLPERSFVAGRLQLPVCARDTGIYIGFLVSMLVISLLHRRRRPVGFPKPATWVVIAIFAGFMAWDGVTSYAALRSTTNVLRLLSGLSMGYAMAAIVVPILNDELWRNVTREPVLSPSWRLLVWMGSLPVAFVCIWYGGPLLGRWYAVGTALAILTTLAAVNLIVVAMLPMFDRRAERLADLVPAAALAFLIAILEVWAAGALKAVLLRLTG